MNQLFHLLANHLVLAATQRERALPSSLFFPSVKRKRKGRGAEYRSLSVYEHVRVYTVGVNTPVCCAHVRVEKMRVA